MPKAKESDQGGFPEHGAAYVEPEEPINPDPDDNNNTGDDDQQKPVEPDYKKMMEDMQKEIGRLSARLEVARAPAEPVKKADPEPEPEWETLLFENPKLAVKKMTEGIRKQITEELTGKYQADQGKKQFWDAFYRDHDDLKEDDELVQSILTANMADLANLPVKEAGDKLADLTRTRILKYTGGKPREQTTKKAIAEGSGAPTPKPVKQDEDDKIVTLSDLIRARKNKRVSKGTAA